MKRILTLAALLGLALGLVGCGGKPAATAQQGTDPTAETGAEEPNSASQAAEPGRAAAASYEVNLPADAPPDDVVTAFLEARRSGDAKTTAGLLTTKARAATAEYKIDVNSEALPDLEFQVAKPRYLKNNPNGAHVNSQWTELLSDGSKATYEVTWVLSKEKAGWRVAGFAAELTPGTPKQFLNFENPEDMIQKQKEAVAAAESATPSASGPAENEEEQAKLPTRNEDNRRKR